MKPTVALVGAEFEENLSIRYLASSIEREGFEAVIIPFNDSAAAREIARRVSLLDPLVVGISVPFQMRARELLGIADLVKQSGVSPHVTAGGHFATFEYDNILRDFSGLDSVVRHEGERTFAELCVRVRDGESLDGLPGAVVRIGHNIVDGGKRPLPPLDDLPFPDRRGRAHRIFGVPTSPIVGSRGCYADCSFCCIYAYAENADGARYRRRSPENIVTEMWEEYSERGVRLFIFHDDNFFVPSEQKNIERYRKLKRLLDERGMDDIALVIKCRPNDVHPDLFALLKSMGMIRAYVGIETNSGEGIVSLNRRITPEDNRRALRTLRELDMYHSFNVLIFDPEATLDGVLSNLDFMEEFADTPFNFCRVEVYAGTPLKNILEHDGRLRGDHFAWGYEMREPRVELLFRIAATAFASRNFKRDGVANLNMGIRFDNEVVRHFYPRCWDTEWHARLTDLSRRIGLNSTALMREAHAFVCGADLSDHTAAKAFTLDIARRVAGADFEFVVEIKNLRWELEERIRQATGSDVVTDAAKGLPVWAAETERLGSSVGLGVSTEVLPAPAGREGSSPWA